MDKATALTAGPLAGLPLPRIRGCPESGQGVHHWLFYAAATLIPFVPPEKNDELASFLEARMTRPPAPSSEAMHAICSARRGSGDADGSVKRRSPRVEFDHFQALAMAERQPVSDYVQFLADRSPVEPRSVSLEGFFGALFEPGETVLLFNRERAKGWCYRVGVSAYLSNFQAGEAGAWFLANPVNGLLLMNPRTGKTSRRSKENVTAFRYALVESDKMPVGQWAAILAQLPLPVVSVTHSGGKSLHALVRVDASCEAEYEKYRQRLRSALVPLGIDEVSLSSVRLTRLPGFLRGGREQTLLFFNPAADGTPIKDLVERRAA